MLALFGKSLLISLLIAGGETLNGIVRVRILTRRFGDRRARAFAVLSGCALIFAIAWFFIPWIAPRGLPGAATVGLVWLAVLVAYDLYLGRVVFKFSWRRIAADFNPCRGNYLLFGLLFLLVAPGLVMVLRG